VRRQRVGPLAGERRFCVAPRRTRPAASCISPAGAPASRGRASGAPRIDGVQDSGRSFFLDKSGHLVTVRCQERPLQRPPCHSERSKNSWRSSSVYCGCTSAFGLLSRFGPPDFAIPSLGRPRDSAVKLRLSIGQRVAMWARNLSARTWTLQFGQIKRVSRALSAAFSSLRRFRSWSKAFSLRRRAISATISCLVTSVIVARRLIESKPATCSVMRYFVRLQRVVPNGRHTRPGFRAVPPARGAHFARAGRAANCGSRACRTSGGVFPWTSGHVGPRANRATPRRRLRGGLPAEVAAGLAEIKAPFR
jgi:hypothetical protein